MAGFLRCTAGFLAGSSVEPEPTPVRGARLYYNFVVDPDGKLVVYAKEGSVSYFLRKVSSTFAVQDSNNQRDAYNYYGHVEYGSSSSADGGVDVTVDGVHYVGTYQDGSYTIEPDITEAYEP